MKCSRCQHESAADAVFCQECGTRLDLACPACGTANQLGAKFCKKCGQAVGAASSAPVARPSPEAYTPKHLAEKILTSKSALEGERKQVTVIFADLKGSMELLADRDPEEARKVLDAVLDRMMEAVHRYEGTVNQVMGDGIMALFGAPVAHEDHGARACYAALRMQESVKRYAEEARHAHGVSVQIRVGLNSGEVVVRAIGSDLRMDYTAVGQTTHLAARMEQLAAPGTIVVTPATLALVEGLVEVTSQGPVPIKGLPEPLEVFEVTGMGVARTRLHAAARRGLTRFVGRDSELEQLWRVQEQAGKGRGQVTALVGEAGVGKSRLVYEFTHSHRLQGWLILEAASVSYGKATSYLPVIALLKGYFKIHDQDDRREIREKVTGKLLTLDEALKPTIPALLALLDVPVDDPEWQTLDPRQRRQRTLDAVKRLLLREAREQPVLLIFEDLHWIDSQTQALLDTLAESLDSARLLLLATYRPEYRCPWVDNTNYNYSQICLDALPADSAGELLDALLGTDPELSDLKQLLVNRGNPFFLEETVRTLVETRALTGERGLYRLEQPVHAIQVPATVQAIVAARIDRLAPEERRLLRIASVVGKHVPLALLERIAELPDEALRRGLDHLQSREFLDEVGLLPDLEYSFKHALTHEVTYGGLLHEHRRALHARIVDEIEMLHQERLDEQIERLAHHALRGEMREKAVHYLRQAGLRATGLSALQNARDSFDQALNVLEALPESQSTLEQAFEIRLEARPVLVQLSENWRILKYLREAEALAERLNDDRRRGRVCAFITGAHSAFGELDEALATGTRALHIARRLGDTDLLILSTLSLEQAHYYRGDYREVVELGTQDVLPADRLYEYFGLPAPAYVYGRAWLVMSLAELGRFAEAAKYVAQVIRFAETTHHQFTIGLAHRVASTLHLLEGDWAKARSATEHWIAAAREGNVVIHLASAIASSAWVLAQIGDVDNAPNRLRENEHLFEFQGSSGTFVNRFMAALSLGQAYLLLGHLDDAQLFADRALESSPYAIGFVAHSLHLLGDIATHPDRFDAERGETYYRQALALAEPRGMRPLVAHCHLGLGKLCARTGTREQAREYLTTATTIYREMDMRFYLEQAEAEMGA